MEVKSVLAPEIFLFSVQIAAMRFRLTFEGEIKPRRRAKLPDIHTIRQKLHPQLKRVWEHPPLSKVKKEWLKEMGQDPATPTHG